MDDAIANHPAPIVKKIPNSVFKDMYWVRNANHKGTVITIAIFTMFSYNHFSIIYFSYRQIQ